MFPSTNHGPTRKSTSKSTAPAASAARRGVECRRIQSPLDPPLQRKYGEQALEPDEATIRLARKISSEVMRDLRRKYGNVDIGMLGI
ncbi:hypothetical protein ANCCAN_27485 [Ancylostoma caninum]|uniref:Uncharacterized protein n=1 Tax=Ancylostoma caninum TaxID=29170 RepID=A0A368F6X0_ANCCA|nr:hypothetical protein ANCCAN_27485 [Ancylostoma caninum]